MPKTKTKAAQVCDDDAERCRLALEASWQIAELFDALVEEGDGLLVKCVDFLPESTVVRALACRGRALASVVMSMLGDSIATVDDARTTVRGFVVPMADEKEAADA